MQVVLLLGASSALTILFNILGKKFQQGFSTDLLHFLCYNFINAAIASVLFFVIGGFTIHMNAVTMLFSALYSLAVIIALVLHILALSRASIALTNITSTAGNTILSTLFGVLVFHEAVTARLTTSLALMLLAIFLPYRRFWRCGQKNSLGICIAYFFSGGLSVMLHKCYTETPGVCDTNSYFLMTNLLIVLYTGVALVIYGIRRPESRSTILRPFSAKQLINIAARTAVSNINAVVVILLIAQMPMSAYTIITSSLTILAGAFLSKFVFRESMPKESWLATVLAIGAIVVQSI